MINREFLDWLSQRPVNDAPLLRLPQLLRRPCALSPAGGTPHRFGLAPETDAEIFLLKEFWTSVDKLRLTPHYRRLFPGRL